MKIDEQIDALVDMEKLAYHHATGNSYIRMMESMTSEVGISLLQYIFENDRSISQETYDRIRKYLSACR